MRTKSNTSQVFSFIFAFLLTLPVLGVADDCPCDWSASPALKADGISGPGQVEPLSTATYTLLGREDNDTKTEHEDPDDHQSQCQEGKTSTESDIFQIIWRMDGAVIGNGPSVSWTAPKDKGFHTLSVFVDDLGDIHDNCGGTRDDFPINLGKSVEVANKVCSCAGTTATGGEVSSQQTGQCKWEAGDKIQIGDVKVTSPAGKIVVGDEVVFTIQAVQHPLSCGNLAAPNSQMMDCDELKDQGNVICERKFDGLQSTTWLFDGQNVVGNPDFGASNGELRWFHATEGKHEVRASVDDTAQLADDARSRETKTSVTVKKK